MEGGGKIIKKIFKIISSFSFLALICGLCISILFEFRDYLSQIPKYSVVYSLRKINWQVLFDWLIATFIICFSITSLISFIGIFIDTIFNKNFNFTPLLIFIWTIGIIVWMVVSLNNNLFSMIAAIVSIYALIYQFINRNQHHDENSQSQHKNKEE